MDIFETLRIEHSAIRDVLDQLIDETEDIHILAVGEEPDLEN